MSRRSLSAAALAFAGMMCAASASAAEPRPVLQHDPFARPLPSTTRAGSASGQPVLRAILVAGARSTANLDGTIVGLGALHRGHRLLEVHEFSVILVKDGRRIAIELDPEGVAP